MHSAQVEAAPTTAGVYEIYCTRNKKSYVGSSIYLRKRLRAHVAMLRTGTHNNIHLQRVWGKYVESDFEIRVLLRCRAEDVLFYEQRAMDSIKPAMNIVKVAGSTAGMKHSEATCRKSSLAAKARLTDECVRAAHIDRFNKLRLDPEVKEAQRAGILAAWARRRLEGRATTSAHHTEKMKLTKRAQLERYLVCGELLCLPEIREKYGLTVYTFRARLLRGWDNDRAALTPVRGQMTEVYKGKNISKKQICKLAKCTSRALTKLRGAGMSPTEIIDVWAKAK